ncbi:hypothetical protein [Flavobacterium johnsoniae]|uniref:hypothetical protein n=1 Tax=Flavobacterium johnsoniae TaxID=986 RepID=UPI00223C3BA4|nr:hypothetical protein [Flavobacterium johnsoniae]
MSFIRVFILVFFFVSIENKAFSQDTISSETSKTTISEGSNKTNVFKQIKLEQLRNKKVVSLSIVLIIILFFLFYFVYQNNRLKQKIKRKDTKQKILLNVINAGIDSQETEQKKLLLFYMII